MSNLDRALHKVEHHREGVWVGYLTPSEIIAIVEAGGIPTSSSVYNIPWIEAKIRKGECGPTTFYFTPRKQLLPLLKREHKKVGTAEKV